MFANVDDAKKEKMFPAFKVTEEMHDTVARLAAKHHRKLMDQVRHLVELGARVEDRHAQLLDKAIEGEALTIPLNQPERAPRHVKAIKEPAAPGRVKGGHSR